MKIEKIHVARFWAKVDVRRGDTCWNWQGAKFTTGYGAFNLGREDGKTRLITSHRFSWIYFYGQIPKCVLHKIEMDEEGTKTRVYLPDHLQHYGG